MAAKSVRGKRSGTWFLVLFGIPFAAVGIGMGVLLARTALAASRAGTWAETPARIVRAELAVSHGSDSTTYRAEAEYTYTFEGRTYTGTRVSLHGGSDNIGSFHQRVHQELAGYRDSGRPFRCYVNPANPSEALLYRGVRWEMVLFHLMFCLVFGGVGIGMMGAGLVMGRRSRQQAGRQSENPDAPWLWKPEWAAGSIRSSERTAMVAAIAFATFWNLISAPLLFFLPAEIRGGNKAAAIGLLFPLVGLGLAAWAIRCVIRRRKFGESVFRMAAVPGVVGGALSGVVTIPVHVEPEDGFKVSLRAVRRTQTGSGKNRHTSEHVEWESSRTISRELFEKDPSRSAVPVLFHIPFDKPPSDDSDSRSTLTWQLSVSAAVPGVDYHASFDVPVFRTADSSPDFRLDESALAPYAAPPSPRSALHAAGIRTEPIAGGTALVFPAGRLKAYGFGLLVAGLILAAVSVLLFRSEAPRAIPWICAVFDVLILLGALDTLCRSSRIEVRRGTLTADTRVLGWHRVRTLAADEIHDFDTPMSGQYGSRVLYDVRAALQSGRHMVLARLLPDRETADAVVAELQQALNDKGGL